MPLIEGIGDEVTALVGCLVVLAIVVIAWMSTRVHSTVHTSVVIIDRERFAELLYRVRGIATRSSAIIRPTLNDTAVSTAATSPTTSTATDDDSGSSDLPDSDGRPLASEEIVAELVERAGEAADTTTASESESSDVHGVDNNKTESAVFHSPSVSSTATSSAASLGSATNADKVEAERAMPTAATNTVASDSYLGSQQGNDSIPPFGQVEIRLQFVDGRQRTVYANPDETIGNFKRCHFASELANNSVVRFIAGGQELRDETSTLRSHRLSTSGAVLHCLVTPARTAAEPPGSHTTQHQFDIGMLMFPLFGSVLAALWYARVVYRGYFNGTSTFSLLAISFLYIVALLASVRGGNQSRAQQQQHAHAD